MVFIPFAYETIRKIANLKMQQEMKKLNDKGYCCKSYTEAVIDKLMFYVVLNQESGARPIVQAIQEYVADALLNSDKKTGIFDVKDGKIVFVWIKKSFSFPVVKLDCYFW